MLDKVSPIARADCSDAEWEARVDLAAAHRMAVLHGFHEGIFNHLTLTVPGKPGRYYQSRSACTGRRSRPPPSWRSALTTAR